MVEKVFKADGRRENITFDQCNNVNQMQMSPFQMGRSQQIKIPNTKQVIGNGNVDELSWTWITQNDTAAMTTTSEKVISTYIRFKWNKLEGVVGFTGQINFILKLENNVLVRKQIDALVEFSGQWIGVRNFKGLNELTDTSNSNHNQLTRQKRYTFEFSFSMTPILGFLPVTNIIANFEKSHITDAILEVEGNQLHVNKSFLSIHSEYFDKLFNSNFKEKSQSTIPIKDADFLDFSNFLSLIYPNQAEISGNHGSHILEIVFFSVEKVGKYLELADMYLMPGVTQKCESFLLQNGRMKSIQKLVFADQHNLNKLLRETLDSVETKEELEGLTLLPEFTLLSDPTKASLLHRFLHFLN